MASTAGGAGSISAAVAAAAVRSAGLVRGGGGGSGSGYRRASRFVYVHMQPRPVNMAESREVLRLLKRFGEVVMFRHLKVSLVFCTCAPVGGIDGERLGPWLIDPLVLFGAVCFCVAW